MLFLDHEIIPSKRGNLTMAVQISSVYFLRNYILLLIIYFCMEFFDHDFTSTLHNKGLSGHKTSSIQSQWTHCLTQDAWYRQNFWLHYIIWLGYQWTWSFKLFSFLYLFKVKICNQTVYFDICQKKTIYWSYYYTVCS